MKTFDHQSGSSLLVEDAEIYHQQIGDPNGEAVVLLHGGFGSLLDFNPILDAIDSSMRIIGIDSRGQGKSTLGNVVLSYERLQEDVEVVLTHLSIEEASVFGISDGGIVAYRLAAYSNIKISKLITIGARWHSDNVTETYQLLSGTTAESWRKKFPQTVELYEKVNPRPDFDRLARELVQMWLNEGSYPGEDVKNVKADALIIRGDRDPLTKRKFVAELADLLDNANLCNIPFAGHEVYREQPAVLMTLLRQFLSD